MARHMAPVMLGLTAFPLAAIGIAAYLAVSAGPQMTAVAGAILLLSCCLLIAAMVTLVKLSRHEAWLKAQQEGLRGLTAKTDSALSRLAAAERRAERTAPAAELEAVAADVSALRREVHDLKGASREAARVASAPEAVPEPVPAAAEAPRAGQREQLNLLLEPVIELATGSTSHYRAQVGLADAQGRMVAHDELMQKAEQGGMRAALDLRMLRMVAPVLRRLRSRNPALRVFVPLGRASLAGRDEAARLLALLQRDADAPRAMVLEFSQQDLGALDAAGIENLAGLARSGATLALRDVYLGGLDLGALRQLGVRFLSFPPHAVDAGSGPTPAWTEFARAARGQKMELVVGNVRTPQQATAATRVARYGHGPFFAPPRKVRPEAGAAPAAQRQASVA